MHDPLQLCGEAWKACFFKVLLGRVIGLDMSRPSSLLAEQGRVEKLICPGQVHIFAQCGFDPLLNPRAVPHDLLSVVSPDGLGQQQQVRVAEQDRGTLYRVIASTSALVRPSASKANTWKRRRSTAQVLAW